MLSPAELEEAARAGTWSVVEAWLDEPGCRVDEAGHAELFWSAIHAKRLDLVRRIIALGANPWRRGDRWSSPIEHALISEDLEMLCCLVENWRGPVTEESQWPLLMQAYGRRNAVFIEYLEKQGLRWQEPTLWHACRLGLLGRAQRAVFCGARINAVDETGTTALIVAAEFGHLELVHWLLENGADVHFASEAFGSALTNAVNWRKSRRPLAIVEALLDAGAEVNTPNFMGTPLILAAGDGDFDAVRLLVARGADLAAQDILGHTAEQIALGQGHEEIARWLVEQRTTRTA